MGCKAGLNDMLCICGKGNRSVNVNLSMIHTSTEINLLPIVACKTFMFLDITRKQDIEMRLIHLSDQLLAKLITLMLSKCMLFHHWRNDDGVQAQTVWKKGSTLHFDTNTHCLLRFMLPLLPMFFASR